MSRRACVLAALIAIVALATACSSPPPEQQLVNDAAAALGGADRLRGLTSISVQGEGDAPNVGQNRSSRRTRSSARNVPRKKVV